MFKRIVVQGNEYQENKYFSLVSVNNGVVIESKFYYFKANTHLEIFLSFETPRC